MSDASTRLDHASPAPTLLVYTKYAEDIEGFARVLRNELPDERLAFATNEEEARPALASAQILYGWGFSHAMVRAMPRLRWIQKMGAGVEDLANDDWPFGTSVVLTRTDGRLIAPRMLEYVLWATLSRTLRIDEIRQLTSARQWRYICTGSIRNQIIGVAGLGEIGGTIARNLAALGATVIGWKRTPGHDLPVSELYCGADRFKPFLARCSTLVLVLPHTAETTRLIDRDTLRALPAGAHLINIGRGGVIDEAALIDALDTGDLAHATLDVFENEPLPPGHRLWTHPRATMTPHIAGPLVPDDVAPHFIANVNAFRHGGAMTNVVDPLRGY